MAYGDLKVNNLIYDTGSGDATRTVISIPQTASPTFTGNITINAQGDFRFADSDSSNYVGFQAPATVSSNLVWTLPAADGSANQLLKTDGSGNLGWASDVALTLVDEDNMASNSASSVPSQQSVKAYVDAGDVNITVADESSDTTCFPLFVTAATGTLPPKSGTNLTFNASSGALTATSFVGALTGNVTGNASGTAATVTGAAQSAITSLGTLTGLTVDGDVTLTGSSYNAVWDKSDNALEFTDSAKASFGNDADFKIFHNGSNNYIDVEGDGVLYVRPKGNFSLQNYTTGEVSIKAVPDGETELYHNGVKRIETTLTGIDVTGTAVVDGITIDGAYEQVAEAVGALEIDCSAGNYFTKTISGNSTFTFANPAASGSVTAFTLELTHSSGTVTWPSSVKWNADTAPTLTTGKTHLFMFVTDDGGTRYRGSALVDYVN